MKARTIVLNLFLIFKLSFNFDYSFVKEFRIVYYLILKYLIIFQNQPSFIVFNYLNLLANTLVYY